LSRYYADNRNPCINRIILFTCLLACGDKTPRMDMEVNITLNGKLCRMPKS